MTHKTTNDTDNNFEKFIKDVVPFIVLIGIFLIVIYYLKFKGPEFLIKPELWGSLGDFIGGILNPIISFCTLMVAYQVWKLQKEESKNTRKAIEDQAKTLEQQRQTQQFFNLLNLRKETLESTNVFLNNSLDVEKKAFEKALENLLSNCFSDEALFKKLFNENQNGHQEPIDSDGLLKLKNDWKKIYSNFLPHFKTCLFILREIQEIDPNNKVKYIEIFKNQLSPSEAVLLGLYLCKNSDENNFINLVDWNDFLSNAKNVSLEIKSIKFDIYKAILLKLNNNTHSESK